MNKRIELTELERQKMAEAGRQSIPCTNGWRSIDTAPKDGTVIFGYKSNGDGTFFMSEVMWEVIPTMYVHVNSRNKPRKGWLSLLQRKEVDLTHWQLLPKPPTGE